MLSVPSVAMMGGTRPMVMISPLMLPRHCAKRHAQQHGEHERRFGIRLDDERHHHRRQAQHRSDGQIDAARDDDHALRQRHHRQDRDVQQDVFEVGEREEVGIAQADERDQQHDETDQRQFAEAGEERNQTGFGFFE